MVISFLVSDYCDQLTLHESIPISENRVEFFLQSLLFLASRVIFLLSIKATIIPLSGVTSQITISLPNGRNNDQTGDSSIFPSLGTFCVQVIYLLL